MVLIEEYITRATSDTDCDGVEVWKPIPDYEGIYEASSFGRIRSLDRIAAIGNRNCHLKGRILSLSTTATGGYQTVMLCGNGSRRRWLVHTLVLSTFKGLPQANQECRHLDGSRTNNRLDNLAWGTRIDNWLDRVRHGTNYGVRGERHHLAKLTDTQVREIFQRYTGRYGEIAQLAKEHGVSSSRVSDIVNGKSWTHITGGKKCLS